MVPAAGAVVGAADVGLGVTIAERVGIGGFNGGLRDRFGGGMVGSMGAVGCGMVVISGSGGLLREGGGARGRGERAVVRSGC